MPGSILQRMRFLQNQKVAFPSLALSVLGERVRLGGRRAPPPRSLPMPCYVGLSHQRPARVIT